MEGTHYKRTTCRLCDGGTLILRVPFGASPVGGAFVDKHHLAIPQESYPLDLYQCAGCGHVQLLDVVNPQVLFSDYSYLSGRTGLISHFAKYASNVIARNDLDENSFVVDIGSNDGCFLNFFRARGIRVLGVDPEQNVAEVANNAGIPTLPVMFDIDAARNIRQKHGTADVISANNVFAHVDDMQGVLAAVQALLSEDGVFYFEVSYLLDVIDNMLLGAIFHEHLCYHTVKPLCLFLERGGLELFDVERVAIQGGSLVCAAQRRGGKRPISPSVSELIRLEDSRQVHGEQFFAPFCSRLADAKASMATTIAAIKGQGLRIAAYGAARGGTFITYLFDLGAHISFIVDDDPLKGGLFSPGWHIPVFPVEELYSRKPEYVAVLAWVHSTSIVEKNRRYLEEGGKFITFFPTIRVIDGKSPA